MQLDYIDEKTNRIHDLIQLGEPQTYFHFDLRITSKCNYNCYYCTDLHCNSNPMIEFDLKKFEQLINELVNKGKKLHVFIYGGEPTLHPQLSDIINIFGIAMKNRGILEVQSNFSLSKEKLLSLCAVASRFPSFRLSGSYHVNHADFKTFMSKATLIKQLGCLGMITFMYNSKKPILDKFKIARNILGALHTEISPLISSSVTEDPTLHETNPFYEIEYLYQNEDVSTLEDYSYVFRNGIVYRTSEGSFKTSQGEVWLNRCNSFAGMMCNVPLERLIIDWDGNAYRCFNNMFASLGEKTFPLFNINELDDKILHDYFSNKMMPVKCIYNKCFFELEHSKWREKDDSCE